MKLMQRGVHRITNVFGVLALRVAVLIMLPLLSPAGAQSNQQTASDHTKPATVEIRVDSLEQWDPLESTCRHASLSIL